MKTNIPNYPARQVRGKSNSSVAIFIKVNGNGEIIDAFPGTCQAWAEPIFQKFNALYRGIQAPKWYPTVLQGGGR